MTTLPMKGYENVARVMRMLPVLICDLPACFLTFVSFMLPRRRISKKIRVNIVIFVFVAVVACPKQSDSL